MKKNSVFATVMELMLTVFAASAMAETHIYISQAAGVNSSATAGTEANPFKSIAYGMMTMANRGTPDPWVVHIRAGTYDANTAKPANEREIFPITLRQGMTIQGDDGADRCIISGEFNPNSQYALLKGDTLTGITIKNLTLTKMNRTTGNGAAAELLKCAGVMQACIVSINKSSYGVVYLTIPVGGRFDVSSNTFSGNSGNNSVFCVGGAFTGNISGNTFSGNNPISQFGSGFAVSGAFTGNISGNLFSGNSTITGSGGGFYIVGAFTGDISGNTFSGNSVFGYGSGFYVSNKITGSINNNVFSRNQLTLSTTKGVGFYLDYSGGSNVIVSNNLFLYNTRAATSTATLNGIGFYSNQNVTAVNNTFYGSSPGESAVNITSYAPNSIIKNNIFADVHTAIWEPTELNLDITHNDFYNTTDILHRNNQPMGNDADYIALLLTGFQNNHTWATGIVGEGIETGVWNANPVYDAATNRTTLTDSTKNWTAGEWKGAMLRMFSNTSSFQHFPIVDNTSNQIMVMGNLAVTTLGNPGNSYWIDDYRLASGSQNIDAGTTISFLSEDFQGDPRPSGAGFDIGADEYFTGVAPGDLNGIGGVDLADAIIALKIVAGINVGNVFLSADVNGGGKIGLDEAIFILQKVADLR